MEKIIHEKIKPDGDIHIPKSILADLGLRVGEEIELKVVDRKVLIEPSRSIVDELTGIIKIDPKLAEEIIEDKELEMEMLED